MANICPICKTGSMMVTKRVLLRGKYNPTSRKRKYPNLQWVTLPQPISKNKNIIKRIKTCISCKKSIAQGKIKVKKMNF